MPYHTETQALRNNMSSAYMGLEGKTPLNLSLTKILHWSRDANRTRDPLREYKTPVEPDYNRLERSLQACSLSQFILV
jgi:hypothetical protein